MLGICWDLEGQDNGETLLCHNSTAPLSPGKGLEQLCPKRTMEIGYCTARGSRQVGKAGEEWSRGCDDDEPGCHSSLWHPIKERLNNPPSISEGQLSEVQA